MLLPRKFLVFEYPALPRQKPHTDYMEYASTEKALQCLLDKYTHCQCFVCEGMLCMTSVSVSLCVCVAEVMEEARREGQSDMARLKQQLIKVFDSQTLLR